MEHRAAADAGPLKWPRPDRAPRQYAYLLDIDDDLAEDFDARTRAAARQRATVRTVAAPAGNCDLSPWFEAAGDGPGLLIIDGLLAFDTSVGDRTATELVGAGDLLQAPSHRPEEMLERLDGWRALCPTRLALLDTDFADRMRPWPKIVEELLRRPGRRIADVDMLRAITCQPRLEVRLVLLLWHFAARWGRVEPAGIRVTLPLTHGLLGQLVAAERPSITHALARLARAGLVTGATCDLHLHGNLERHLGCLAERTSSLPEQPGPKVRSARQVA
jgi:hypothetical protein